jgi:gas vesicle protein
MESNSQQSQSSGLGFIFGLMAGTLVGAGLALWLTPGAASELGARVTDNAKALGKGALDGYDEATGRVVNAVDELARKGNRVRDDVAESVGRGAHEVERFAMAVKSEPGKSRS